MTAELVIPLAGVGLFAVFVLLTAALRVPAWNPLYLFAAVFGVQILAALVLASDVGYAFDVWFWVHFVTAEGLFLLVLFVFNVKYLHLIRSRRTLEHVFAAIRLSPDRAWLLRLALFGMAAIHLGVLGYVTLKWKAPPVIALHRYGDAIAQEVNRDGIVAISVYEPFTVPFIGIFADSTVAATVAMFFVLWADARNRGNRLPWSVKGALLAIGCCAILHVQRNSFLGGALAAVYLGYLTNVIRVRHLAIVGVMLLSYIAFVGEFRNENEGGSDIEMEVAELKSISVFGKLLRTPIVYLGTGPLNFDSFWSNSDMRGNGNLILSSIIPGKLEPLLGISRYDVVGHFLDQNLFVIYGQTLRTGWFDFFFFDFGLAGLYAGAVLLPLAIFYVYYRSLAANGRSPSLLFFALVRPICFFAFINWFFSMTAWSALFVGLFLDWLVRNSLVRHEASHTGRPDGEQRWASLTDRRPDAPDVRGRRVELADVR